MRTRYYTILWLFFIMVFSPVALAQEVHEPKTSEKRLMWDDENRLKGISDNGFVSHYTYDASGERVLKQSGNGDGVHVNSEWSGGSTSTKGYTLYVSPYMVVKNGAEYSKHIYVGSQRIVSKLGDATTYQGLDPRKVPKAGDGLDPSVRPNWEEKIRLANVEVQAVYDTLKVPYSGSSNAPPFVICPACKPSNGATSTTPSGATSGSATWKLANPEKLMYYYHPDHLGSSSYISNLNGEIAQHIEYVPFGEVFLEERNGSYGTPYLFNAKELDEETGLYYYGARYLNPKTSLWLSVDPLSGFNPLKEVEHYINGQHNGGVYNSGNNNPYIYTYQNPIIYVDPNGKQSMAGALMGVPNGEMDNVHRGWRNGLRNGGYAMDFVPVVGDGKGFIEGLVGTDMQGNKMSWFDRGLSILFLSELRDVKNGNKIIHQFINFEKASKLLNISEKSAKLIKSLDKSNAETVIKTNSNTFADAKKLAQEITGVGDEAVDYVSRAPGSPLNGKVVGKKEGNNMWRLDIDKKTGEAHINYSVGKGNKGRIDFGGGERNVKSIINNVMNK